MTHLGGSRPGIHAPTPIANPGLQVSTMRRHLDFTPSANSASHSKAPSFCCRSRAEPRLTLSSPAVCRPKPEARDSTAGTGHQCQRARTQHAPDYDDQRPARRLWQVLHKLRQGKVPLHPAARGQRLRAMPSSGQGVPENRRHQEALVKEVRQLADGPARGEARGPRVHTAR